MRARSLAQTWREAVAHPPRTPPFLVEGANGWRPLTWAEAGRAVEELAAGLLSLGVAKGDRVAILARTRLEWILCDWALIAIGAPVVPIYPTSSALEVAFILGNCGATVAVCENAEQLAKAEPARRELEALDRLIAIEDASGAALALDDLRERGRTLLAERPAAVDDARAGLTADDLLTIVYTSGTTGPPKGCMLRHRNYQAMVEMVTRVPDLVRPGERTVLFLPLAHVFGRLIAFLGPSLPLTIAPCPDVARVAPALREVAPTIFAGVPRLFERMQAALEAGLESGGPARSRLIAWARGVGRRASVERRAGRRIPPLLALELLAADRLVFGKVKARFGGRIRHLFSGAAPLPPSVAEFFHSLDLLVLEGYGLTECTTVATVNRPGAYRFGTVGQAIPGVEVRIADDGEVLVRGENVFAGYFRDEAATRAVLDDEGWLATGDVGRLDADGFLTITDRKKDIIVTAAGKKVWPQGIETALTSSRYVTEALVVGEGRPYLVALLVPNRDEAGRVATTDAELRRLLEQVVADVNRSQGEVARIRRFAVLPREFSLEHNELTPTLKVKRRVCEEHFREEIERLYRPEGRG